MAGLVDNSVTYTGKDAEGFYSKALLTGNTKDVIRKVPNVKTKIKLGSLDLGNILQPDGCSVDESGTYTLGQKTLEVCDFAFNVPMCEKDFEGNYLSEGLKPGSNQDQNFPSTFVDYLFNLVAEVISKELEALIWSGDTAGSPASLCDGFIKKFLADSDVVDVATPLTLTDSNIVGELKRITKAIPKAVKNKGKEAVKIFMSIEAFDLYEDALITANPALYAFDMSEIKKKFKGYEIIVSPGMPDNTIVVCDPMNLWYGFDLMDDEKQVEFIKNPLAGQGKKSNITGSLKWGVQYGEGTEIVLYGTGS